MEALRAKAVNYRLQANVEAERLEEQARTLREIADERADALAREAAAVEKQ